MWFEWVKRLGFSLRKYKHSEIHKLWSSPCVITFFPISKFSYIDMECPRWILPISIRAWFFVLFIFSQFSQIFSHMRKWHPKCDRFEDLANTVLKTNLANFVYTSLKLHNPHDPNGHGHSTKISGQDSIPQVVNSIKIHG